MNFKINIKIRKRERSVMQCFQCGFGVYTMSPGHCAKCNSNMVFICKEMEYKQKKAVTPSGQGMKINGYEIW